MRTSTMPGATAYARSAATNAAGTKVRISTSGWLLISMILILVFEGAIRKWISESSAVPLILMRDLIATYAIARALMQGHFRTFATASWLLLVWSCIVVGWGLLQLTLGESSFAMLMIGLRFWLLYLWFGMAVACSMSERDYLASVRVLLALLVMMAPLVVAQRYAPVDALVNKTLDEDIADVFVVIEGVVRTTGTFSFTTGLTLFVSACTAFALGAFEARKRRLWHRLLALLILGALFVCTLVSGARGLFIFMGPMVAVFLLGNLLFAPLQRKGIALLTALFVVLALGSLAFLFQDSIDAIQQRFETASESEDLLSRVEATFIGERDVLERVNWLGAGIGVGSNLAQYVHFGNRMVFVYAETETGRTLVEGGLAGAVLIVFKLIAIAWGIAVAFKRSMQARVVFPLLVWMAVSLALLTWPAIGQLTANGIFGVLLALALACLRFPTLRLFGR